jgi:hypothetical protein
LGVNTERWSRAVEEMKLYDDQLKNLTETKIFKDMLSNKASKILDPRTQLFYVSPSKKRSVRRVSNRTAKK